MKRNLLSLALLAGATAITGCGGSSGSSSAGTATGQVVDSAVSGLSYRCAGKTGQTDASGYYSCRSGSTVTFYLGDVELGSVTARDGDTVTPRELVGAADASNLAMVLLALDEDGDPDNGIQLPEDVDISFAGQSIDFSDDGLFVDEGIVDNLIELIKGDSEADLPDLATVNDHLAQSERDIVAGLYQGSLTISGESAQQRTFVAVVNHSGFIVGESWVQGDSASPQTESGQEADMGMPWINMFGAEVSAPIGIEPEAPMVRIAIESELEMVLEEPEYNGTIENGLLLASEGDSTWTASRVAAAPLPLDPDSVSYYTGGTYQVVLYQETEEDDEIGPRAALEVMSVGDVQIFSNGNVVLRILEWHCDGMPVEDPNYSSCGELDMAYGGDETNGIVTAVDEEAGTLSFAAIDNNIVVRGTLAKPVVISITPRAEIPADAGMATLSGTWAADVLSLSGELGGGSVID